MSVIQCLSGVGLSPGVILICLSVGFSLLRSFIFKDSVGESKVPAAADSLRQTDTQTDRQTDICPLKLLLFFQCSPQPASLNVPWGGHCGTEPEPPTFVLALFKRK